MARPPPQTPGAKPLVDPLLGDERFELIGSGGLKQVVTLQQIADFIGGGGGVVTTVPNGGTGLAALTLNGILFGNGVAPVGVTAAGTTGQFLGATTGSAPTWKVPGDGSIIAVPGGGVNATASLQASVLAAQVAGVSLIMPAGTYTITPAVLGGVIISAPLTIIADPQAKIVGVNGAYASVFMIGLASDNVTIIGGDWDWNHSSASAVSGIFLVTGNHVTIRDGVYRNGVWSCLEIHGANNFAVHDCGFYANAGGDINYVCAGSDCADIAIYDNYFECPASNFEAINIVNLSGGTADMGSILIDGNRIYGSSSPTVASCGIQIWANASNYQSGPFVLNNNIVHGFEIGLSPAFCRDGAVTGNAVYGSSSIGIEIAGFNCVCAGNVVNGQGITRYGITCDGASNNDVTGNAVINLAPANGLGFSVLQGGSGNSLFSGNHVGQEAVGHSGAGFEIHDCDRVTMVGNHVNFPNSTSAVAFYAFNSGGLTIIANYADVGSSSNSAILIENTVAPRDNIKIKQNVFTGVDSGLNVFFIGTMYGRNIDVDGFGNAAVTQATSKSTAIASTNAFQIDITMNNAALAAGAAVSFNWPNLFVAAADTVTIQHVSGGTIGAYAANAVCSNDNVSVTLTNISTASKSEAVVLRCVLTKSKAL